MLQMTDLVQLVETESNDMCFEAGRRFVPEIAFCACAHATNTHIIRFVSTSRTSNPSTAHRLVEMCSRFQFFYMRMRSNWIAQLRMRRRKRRILVEIFFFLFPWGGEGGGGGGGIFLFFFLFFSFLILFYFIFYFGGREFFLDII